MHRITKVTHTIQTFLITYSGCRSWSSRTLTATKTRMPKVSKKKRAWRLTWKLARKMPLEWRRLRIGRC